MLAGPSLPVRAVSCGEDAALILERSVTKNSHAMGATQRYRAVTVEMAILEAAHQKLRYDCLTEASHRCCDKFCCPYSAYI